MKKKILSVLISFVFALPASAASLASTPGPNFFKIDSNNQIFVAETPGADPTKRSDKVHEEKGQEESFQPNEQQSSQKPNQNNDLLEKAKQTSDVSTQNVASSKTEKWDDYNLFIQTHDRWSFFALIVREEKEAWRALIGSDRSLQKDDKVFVFSKSPADQPPENPDPIEKGYLWQKINGDLYQDGIGQTMKPGKYKNEKSLMEDFFGVGLTIDDFIELVSAQIKESRSGVKKIEENPLGWPKKVSYENYLVEYEYAVENSIPAKTTIKDGSGRVLLSIHLIDLKALNPNDGEEGWPMLENWKDILSQSVEKNNQNQ